MKKLILSALFGIIILTGFAQSTATTQIRTATYTSSHTLVVADYGKRIKMNCAGACNLTVPTNATLAIPVNTWFWIEQNGAGTVTIVAAGGVTITTPSGYTLDLPGQGLTSTLVKNTTNTWNAYNTACTSCGGGGTWGSITGTLSAQTDLNTALNAKAPTASPTFTGTVVIPTPFTLGATSVTTTGTQLNYLNAATGTTGTNSTNLVFSGTPTIATPSFTTGFTIGGAAASGKFIVGNGTNYVASTSTIPTSAGATANKVLLSDGTNYVLSTPTFPNASATTRKKIVSDGTNWIASTETWAVPGTSGNLLQSDGTNWVSATISVLPSSVQGDIFYASATNTIAALAKSTSGTRVLSNQGTSNNPTWTATSAGSAVTLTNTYIDLNGTGTPSTGAVDAYGFSALLHGVSSVAIGDLIQGATAANTFAVLPSVATGNVLISGGVTTVSSWGKVGLTTHVSGDLPFANLTQGSALSVLGVTGNGTADVASIAAGTDGHILRRSGTALTFGKVLTNFITGTATNDNATAGDIGEEVNAIVSTYTNYTTTATYQNITSITLTAGDWDLAAFFTYSANSSTITAASNAVFVISTTTASAAGATEGKNIAYIPQAALLGTSSFSDSISPYRVSISGSTTYYLNSQATFTLGNPQFVGSLRARRIR